MKRDADTIAMEMLLIGSAVTDTDLAEMLKTRVNPEMLNNDITGDGFRAIITEDRELMTQWLKRVNVNLGRSERATDAIFRTVLMRSEERQRMLLAETEAVIKWNDERREKANGKGSNNAGSATQATKSESAAASTDEAEGDH